jgi:hypothetical protein
MNSTYPYTVSITGIYGTHKYGAQSKIEAMLLVLRFTNCGLLKARQASDGDTIEVGDYQVTISDSPESKTYWPPTNEAASDYWAHRDERQRGVR